MCQLVKGRRALQSIVGEYDVGKSAVHDIIKNENNVLAIQKASKHSQIEEEWSLLQLSHLQKLPANHCRQCSHTYVYTSSNNPVYHWNYGYTQWAFIRDFPKGSKESKTSHINDYFNCYLYVHNSVTATLKLIIVCKLSCIVSEC